MDARQTMKTLEQAPPAQATLAHADDLSMRWEDGALHLTCPGVAPNGRTVLFLSDHGGPSSLEGWKICGFGGHGLWGCIELARMGYRIVMPRVGHWGRGRIAKHLATDLRAAWVHARRLGPNDLVYCVHNVLWWTPLLSRLGQVKAKLVAMLFAKEPLPMASRFAGVIGMTRVATEHAKANYPKAATAHIQWAVELSDHHHRALPYDGRWGLACGVTGRDYPTVARAFEGHSGLPLRVCARGRDVGPMPAAVQPVTQNLSPEELVNDLYAGAAYNLIPLPPDPGNREALGCKNLLEAMALARPVIKTRTGAVDVDLDIEEAGVGLLVPPGDAEAMRRAVETLEADPAMAAAMGLRGRALCESFYNMPRFAAELHGFFNAL